MGASPTVKVTLDERVLTEVCSELDLAAIPSIRFLYHARGNRCYGDYNGTLNRVRIFIVGQYDADGLRFVQLEVVKTVLHELRHAHQKQHNPEVYSKYHDSKEAFDWCERDAEGYAETAVARWRGLATVKRKFHGTAMSKLAQAERNVRRPV